MFRLGSTQNDFEKYKTFIKELVCWCIRSLNEGIIGIIIFEKDVMFWHEQGSLIKYIGKKSQKYKNYGYFLIEWWINQVCSNNNNHLLEAFTKEETLGFFKKNKFQKDEFNENYNIRGNLLCNGETVVLRKARLNDWKPIFKFWKNYFDTTVIHIDPNVI